MEDGGGVDVVYLDFSKAFDKVEHGVLIHKLKGFKVLGKVGVWLAKFSDSTNRQHAVVVDGRMSGLGSSKIGLVRLVSQAVKSGF